MFIYMFFAMLNIHSRFFWGKGCSSWVSQQHQQIGKSRYEGPNNTDYRPGNTHDRLTADPYLGKRWSSRQGGIGDKTKTCL